MGEEEYSSKDLDHLGIVSAMCDEIDLVNTIDRLIPPDPRAIWCRVFSSISNAQRDLVVGFLLLSTNFLLSDYISKKF